jgi:hypothetical protein
MKNVIYFSCLITYFNKKGAENPKTAPNLTKTMKKQPISFSKFSELK